MSRLSDVILNPNDFEIIRELGKGSFGIVYLVKQKSTQKLFAAKVSLREFGNPTEQKFFFRELESFSLAKNPAILPFIGFSLTDFEQCFRPTIFTEFMPQGSLEQVIEKRITLSSTQQYILLLGIAKGMKYLHSIKIAHRDLKPANILIDENYYPYICDFGESRYFSKESQSNLMQTITGSLEYMAPEIHEGDLYTNQVDVFSFAITIYQLFSGKLNIYNGIRGLRIPMEVVNGKRPDLNSIHNEDLKQLLTKCWSSQPLERPTFDEIYDDILTGNYQNSLKVDKQQVSKYLNLFHEQATVATQEEKGISDALLENGDYYIVLNSTGKIASIQKNTCFVNCLTSSLKGSFESFHLIHNSDGTISLKSNANNLFVTAELNNGNQLIANRKAIRSWEKFKLIPSSDSSFFIQSASCGKYIISDRSMLSASSDTKPDDMFTFYNINDESKGKLSLNNKQIFFKGKTFEFADEFLISGEEALERELSLFPHGEGFRIYPQGIDYCESLVRKQQESNRSG